MKNFFEIFVDEEKSIEAPWWGYAIVVPVAMVLIMGLAGWLETAFV